MDRQLQVQLFDLLKGMMRSRVVYTAARLDIADKLRDGPKNLSMLAEEIGTHEPSLYRLLRALASIGLFTEVEPRSFANTELSSLLRSDHPASLRDVARYFGSDVFWKTWGALDYSIRTGERAFDHVFHERNWSYFAAHPDAAETFQRGMTVVSQLENAAVSRAYDFSVFETVVDVGGGHGWLLTHILHNHPNVRGILFDTTATVEQAKEQLSSELKERGDLVGGSFFESVPAGADAYIMKNVLHDWSDEQCMSILKNCRQVIKPTGKVLVVEHVMPEANESARPETFFLDLTMLLLEEGCQRSQKQFQQLYEAAGLKLTRLIPTEAPGIYIVEGVAQA